MALCASPACLAIWLAAAGVAVAVNATGVNAPALADNPFAPALVPSVQLPTVAMPPAVVTGEAPVRLPPPEVTVKVTVTPATGFPNWSLTITDGAVATAVFTAAGRSEERRVGKEGR